METTRTVNQTWIIIFSLYKPAGYFLKEYYHVKQGLDPLSHKSTKQKLMFNHNIGKINEVWQWQEKKNKKKERK